jgi:hypothetical protein
MVVVVVVQPGVPDAEWGQMISQMAPPLKRRKQRRHRG